MDPMNPQDDPLLFFDPEVERIAKEHIERPRDPVLRCSGTTWTTPAQTRRWREVFEGERYMGGFCWKAVEGGCRLVLRGDDAMLVLNIRWPRLPRLSLRWVDRLNERDRNYFWEVEHRIDIE